MQNSINHHKMLQSKTHEEAPTYVEGHRNMVWLVLAPSEGCLMVEGFRFHWCQNRKCCVIFGVLKPDRFWIVNPLLVNSLFYSPDWKQQEILTLKSFRLINSDTHTADEAFTSKTVSGNFLNYRNSLPKWLVHPDEDLPFENGQIQLSFSLQLLEQGTLEPSVLHRVPAGIIWCFKPGRGHQRPHLHRPRSENTSGEEIWKKKPGSNINHQIFSIIWVRAGGVLLPTLQTRPSGAERAPTRPQSSG